MRRIFVVACAVCVVCSVGFAGGPAFMTGGLTNSGGNTRALADCGTYAYQQPFDDANYGTAVTSDGQAGFIAGEATVVGATPTPLGEGSVNNIKVWGIEAFNDGSWHVCNDAGAPFEIGYYTAGSNEPGTLVSTSIGTATAVDTGILFAGAWPVYEYTIPLVSDLVGTETWISVQRQDNADDCWFMWVNETVAGTYDDFRVQGDGTVWEATTGADDLTMCVDWLAPDQPTPTADPDSGGEPIPTMNAYGIFAMIALLFGIAVLVIIRRR